MTQTKNNASFYSEPAEEGLLLRQPNASISNQELLSRLEKQVFTKRPMLGEIMYDNKDISLYDFSKRTVLTPFAPQNTKRRDEFLSVFREETTRLLGKEIATSAVKQLETYYSISTTDHHSPLTYAGYISNNVITSLPYEENTDPDLAHIITLSCANISFDNFALPRGLLFNSRTKENVTTNQLVFFPRKVRPFPVFSHENYTNEAIAEAKNRISSWQRDGIVDEKIAQRLILLLDEVYGNEDVLNATYYSEQISKTNALLWNKCFQDNNHPSLIHLEQENIVIKLLLNYHLDQNTVINKILFDSTYHDLVLKHFDGISGAFTKNTKRGSFLFWGLPKGHYRLQLWKHGNTLVSEDGSYHIELTPEKLRKALEAKELIPTTMLSFILLSFYYGLRLIGGLGQTTALTQMKLSYVEMLKELDEMESVELCQKIPTTELTFPRPILGFLEDKLSHQKIPASTIDLLLYGNSDTLDIMRKEARDITVSDTLRRFLPNIYKQLYQGDEQDPQLAAVTEEQIEGTIGLQEKIIPFAQI